MENKNIMEYRPSGIWCNHDFYINKHYWRKVGIGNAESIRTANLLDVARTLRTHGIVNWLQGQTLLGIFRDGELLDDHDDDLGIWYEDKVQILSSVKADLEQLGFRLVRSNDHMVSFERDFRYLDICFFKSYSRRTVGYNLKRFNQSHFQKFDEVNWAGATFQVPSSTESLLNAMYPTTLWRRTIQSLRDKYLYRLLKRRLKFLPKVVFQQLPKLLHYPSPCPRLAELCLKPLGFRLKALSEEEFLNTLIEPEDSFNWIWRARHLNPVTCNGKYQRIGEILEYLKSDSVRQTIEADMEEADTSEPFFPPTNFDMRFWWSGDNYFYYCVKYGFRKGVQPYSKVNDYIESGQKPLLYSKEYYDSLPVLDGAELSKFLSTTPIEIEKGAVVGGKHRAFAMIGRMVNGEAYLPMKALVG